MKKSSNHLYFTARETGHSLFVSNSVLNEIAINLSFLSAKFNYRRLRCIENFLNTGTNLRRHQSNSHVTPKMKICNLEGIMKKNHQTQLNVAFCNFVGFA